jgi:hypothetical protein
MVPTFVPFAAPSNEQSQHLKADGTPDMRYNDSQQAVAVAPQPGSAVQSM